jgi:hypothetical protein
MARFTSPDGTGAPGPTGPAGADGANGANGADGADGADALWNFIGEYDNGADYYPGDLVTYNGGTYYRIGEPNPGYPPGTSYWTTIAEPGTDGSGLPSGGTDGQILAKIDGTDYNTEWIDNFTSTVKHLVKYVGNPTIPIGTPVYTVLSGNGNSSTNIPVNVASNASEATSSKTMGLIEASVEKNGFVYVVTEGLVAGIDTSTANTGDPVWLGTNGAYIFGLANKPIAPAHLVFLGVVTRGQQENGEVFVKVQNGFELDELHTVSLEAASSIANNEVLAFDSASGLWKNKTISDLAGLTYDGTDLSLSGRLNITTSSGDEGGEIFLNKPVTNTSLNGGVTIDVYRNRLRIFEQGGNARGTYLDLAKAPDGVAGELSFKASGFVNAGVDVTLGNLRARIPTSGNRSLQLSTATGTYSVYGSDVHSQGGVSGSTIEAGFAVTITTTPTYIVPGYHFATSGATQTWILMDTSNTIAWRVTAIIGAGYSNNFISIERL